MNKMTNTHQQQQLKTIERKMQGLRNEMEFVEILAQFWPWGNMAERFDRLQEQLAILNREHQQMNSANQSVQRYAANNIQPFGRSAQSPWAYLQATG